MATLLTTDNPVFASFGFYALIVLLKMLVVQLTVSYQRISRNVYRTPEDVKGMDPRGKRKLKVTLDDDVVERHRSCHLNDLENIIPFVLIGLFYVATNPAAWTAILLFRIFAGIRIIHSIAYLGKIPQPARGLAFGGGFIVNSYMAVVSVMYFMKFM